MINADYETATFTFTLTFLLFTFTFTFTVTFPTFNLSPLPLTTVSIGRRLQDPMAELVKIEPRHIGVGMYQHDVNDALLRSALDGVVEDCVSFVGVDLNTCSEALLRRVAGMNAARAKKVIEHREKLEPFSNRQQILGVKGIGPKVFQQCAGFVRIMTQMDDGGGEGMKAEDSEGR